VTYKIYSDWSPENENCANFGNFKTAKGGICNLFFQQDFIQISSTGYNKKEDREEHIHWNKKLTRN
jgi:hypothetical protein